MTGSETDTICAIATSLNPAGVGIVRVSGPSCRKIAQELIGQVPQPRYAKYSEFRDDNSKIIDTGILLYFKAPSSFTGEDILEIQGHGGTYILNALLKYVVKLGARIARPGEFSERAFLNGKLDLAQAEAIADLIGAGTEQAARSAVRTLEGEFSRKINKLAAEITDIRVFLEATIDFSDQEIDFISENKIHERLLAIRLSLDSVFLQARNGALLLSGMHVTIAGKPNAGKSSLLNALSGKDSAIVTDIPGTTRDLLKETIDLDGLPVHFHDTAGLRATTDKVELEGVKRARNAVSQADLVLLVIDTPSFLLHATCLQDLIEEIDLEERQLLPVFNKIDLLSPDMQEQLDNIITASESAISISAKNGDGISELKLKIKSVVGFQDQIEDSFIARERHLTALNYCSKYLLSAFEGITDSRDIEIVAEDLRAAHRFLGEITGQVSSDELLGSIFSSFCIGK